MLGTGGAVQRRQARLDGRGRWLSKRWRHLHRLHYARLPRQVHAVHEPAAGVVIVGQRGTDLWEGHSRVSKVYPGLAEPRAELADQGEQDQEVIEYFAVTAT